MANGHSALSASSTPSPIFDGTPTNTTARRNYHDVFEGSPTVHRVSSDPALTRPEVLCPKSPVRLAPRAWLPVIVLTPQNIVRERKLCRKRYWPLAEGLSCVQEVRYMLLCGDYEFGSEWVDFNREGWQDVWECLKRIEDDPRDPDVHTVAGVLRAINFHDNNMRCRNEELVDVRSKKAHQIKTKMTKHDIIKAFCVGYGCDGAGGGHQGCQG